MSEPWVHLYGMVAQSFLIDACNSEWVCSAMSRPLHGRRHNDFRTGKLWSIKNCGVVVSLRFLLLIENE